jgi:hypothetical protein
MMIKNIFFKMASHKYHMDIINYYNNYELFIYIIIIGDFFYPL